jgi:hypothetical protein
VSLPPQLDVRLSNSDVTTHIGPLLSGLSYRSAVPGGFASAQIAFKKPLDVRRQDVTAYTEVVISDRRSGGIVWQGHIEDPGPAVLESGAIWQLTAMGPSARASDITGPRHYIESDPAAFYPRNQPLASVVQQVGASPVGGFDEAIVITAPGGTVLGVGIVGTMFYDRLVQSGQQVGGVAYTRFAGKTDANYQNELALVADDGSPATETPVSQNWSTISAAVAAKVVGTDWTAGMDIVRFTCRRSAGGATTVADDATWGMFANLYVAARRLDATGAFVTNAEHAVAYVTADEVFADLIGAGWLPFDGATATIAAGSYHIDQLTYQDGANAQQIMDDVLALQNDMFWAAWEGTPPRCELSAWPTTAAYIASVEDGYEAPSSSADLFSEVSVRYIDRRGRVKTLLVPGTFGTLVDAGITRRGFIDLTSDAGSPTNAQQIAANFLTDHAYPPNGGTVTIARPILNRVSGVIEQPHEVRPGRLLILRGVNAYPDALNATGRDGQAIVRIVATDYDAATNSVTCELDSYSRALARSLVRSNRRLKH